MTDSSAPEADTRILTRSQLEALLNSSGIGPDDDVIIAVFEPDTSGEEGSEGFSEGAENPEAAAPPSADEDGDDYVECVIRDHAVSNSIDHPGKKALLLFVDPQQEYEEAAEREQPEGDAPDAE